MIFVIIQIVTERYMVKEDNIVYFIINIYLHIKGEGS